MAGVGGDLVYGSRSQGCRRCRQPLAGLPLRRRYCDNCRSACGRARAGRPLTRPCHNCGHEHKTQRKRYCELCSSIGSKRAAALKTRYGLTVPGFFRILERQNGTCAICGCDLGVGSACVDHNHKTGSVRGLLCHKCNAFIGMADESVDVLTAAIAYLGAFA